MQHNRAHMTAELAVGQALEYLADRRETSVTLDVLARKVGMTPSHFQRTFTRLVGMSPKKYGAALRMGLLKAHALEDTLMRITRFPEALEPSRAVYYRENQNLATTGTDKRRGRETVIQYAIIETSLGLLLAATTTLGICAITLGDKDTNLARALEAEYPHARLERISASQLASDETHRAFSDHIQEITRYLEGQQQHLAIRLDLIGTPFEQKVWDTLRAIPYGETRTYTEVARMAGKSEAVRAVAQACAKNPVALVIPCHRVVRKNGSLGEYRWGASRKATLLAQEQQRRTA